MHIYTTVFQCYAVKSLFLVIECPISRVPTQVVRGVFPIALVQVPKSPHQTLMILLALKYMPNAAT